MAVEAAVGALNSPGRSPGATTLQSGQQSMHRSHDGLNESEHHRRLREQTSRQVRKVLRDSLIYDSESDGGEGNSRDATSLPSRRRRSAARSRMKNREGSASKAILAHNRSLADRGGAGGGADSDEDGWREDVAGQGGFVGEHDDERSNTSGGGLDKNRRKKIRAKMHGSDASSSSGEESLASTSLRPSGGGASKSRWSGRISFTGSRSSSSGGDDDDIFRVPVSVGVSGAGGCRHGGQASVQNEKRDWVISEENGGEMGGGGDSDAAMGGGGGGQSEMIAQMYGVLGELLAGIEAKTAQIREKQAGKGGPVESIADCRVVGGGDGDDVQSHGVDEVMDAVLHSGGDWSGEGGSRDQSLVESSDEHQRGSEQGRGKELENNRESDNDPSRGIPSRAIGDAVEKPAKVEIDRAVKASSEHLQSKNDGSGNFPRNRTSGSAAATMAVEDGGNSCEGGHRFVAFGWNASGGIGPAVEPRVDDLKTAAKSSASHPKPAPASAADPALSGGHAFVPFGWTHSGAIGPVSSPVGLSESSMPHVASRETSTQENIPTLKSVDDDAPPPAAADYTSLALNPRMPGPSVSGEARRGARVGEVKVALVASEEASKMAGEGGAHVTKVGADAAAHVTKAGADAAAHVTKVGADAAVHGTEVSLEWAGASTATGLNGNEEEEEEDGDAAGGGWHGGITVKVSPPNSGPSSLGRAATWTATGVEGTPSPISGRAGMLLSTARRGSFGSHTGGGEGVGAASGGFSPGSFRGTFHGSFRGTPMSGGDAESEIAWGYAQSIMCALPKDMAGVLLSSKGSRPSDMSKSSFELALEVVAAELRDQLCGPDAEANEEGLIRLREMCRCRSSEAASGLLSRLGTDPSVLCSIAYLLSPRPDLEKDGARSMEAGLHRSCQETASACLRHLSAMPAVRQCLADQGTVLYALSSVLVGGASTSVRQKSAATIANLCSDGTPRTRVSFCYSDDAIVGLHRLMMSDQAANVESALAAFSNMCLDRDAAEVLVRSVHLGRLAALLSPINQTTKIQVRTAGLIRNLSKSRDARGRIAACPELMASLQSILTSATSDVKARSRARSALAAVARGDAAGDGTSTQASSVVGTDDFGDLSRQVSSINVFSTLDEEEARANFPPQTPVFAKGAGEASLSRIEVMSAEGSPWVGLHEAVVSPGGALANPDGTVKIEGDVGGGPGLGDAPDDNLRHSISEMQTEIRRLESRSEVDGGAQGADGEAVYHLQSNTAPLMHPLPPKTSTATSTKTLRCMLLGWDNITGAPALDQLTDWKDGSMWLNLVSGTPDDVAAAVGELKGRLNESEEAAAEIAKTPGVVIGLCTALVGGRRWGDDNGHHHTHVRRVAMLRFALEWEIIAMLLRLCQAEPSCSEVLFRDKALLSRVFAEMRPRTEGPLTQEEVDALGGTERRANAASLLALCLLDGSKYDALNNVLGVMEKVQDSWWYQTTDCK